ncbi:related to GATA transcription factor [Cephalotrichum gorgonifer]|uniref:Related to GATA transcription factor n=1 Tax=Cephalotrichum gorgonifer TaxID=2041049 RepID=A0AAE8SRK2_9PEZI|nr:related to GATA transcription factor [Cephalotrichum gorgonifer]
MTQQGFGHFGGSHGGGAIDPNDLMSGNYGNYPSNNFASNSNNPSSAFSGGGAIFDDDELLDGLASPADQNDLSNHGQEFSNMGDMGVSYNQGVYSPHQNGSGMSIGQHINGYSNTPDGEPIHSPFVHSFGGGAFRQVHHPIQSPMSGYSGSPLGASDVNTDDPNYLKARAQLSQSMQRKASNTRTPMTPKTNPIHATGFGPQPIRTSGLADKSSSGQWMPTPGGSMGSYNSGFSPPMQPSLVQINEVMMKGGTSMPAKLGMPPTAASTQDLKRKRRRESHNLVERRRRDNINERIQDLSRLVPGHRLEDEKIRKMIQNGTPLSPTLGANQATSGLAGPGARRAASATGNITTGLPLEEKDKGPNKGDILNGSVSWTRDLMWMLHLKLQQQEELMNYIAELGGQFPFELTDDEKRMQTELMDTMSRNDGVPFGYSRTAGSGLRVPQHTDYRGQPLGASGSADASLSPETRNHGIGDLNDPTQFWHDPDDDRSVNNSLNFKEEDEYDLEMTQ